MAQLTDDTFHASKEDFELIASIAKRAERELIAWPDERMTTIMDLTVVNNTVGLRLQELLDAPMLDFSHDLYGIREHINRQTYELEGIFLPRFAR